MIDPFLEAWNIYFFYLISGFIIHGGFYNTGSKYWMSWVYAGLIVLVSSEFWEIPIFFMAYTGAPGYGAPSVFNHLIVLIMAIVLLAFSKFHVDLMNSLALVSLQWIDLVFLLIFPGLLSSWILRAINLAGLSWIFLREVWRHG